MNIGFVVGAAVFVVAAVVIAWRQNLPKNLEELRAYAFIKVISETGYNANGANRIAAEAEKNDLLRLAPEMYKFQKLVFGGDEAKMIAFAVESGYQADYLTK